MCGICGIFSKNKGEISESILHNMNLALRHRGPDDEGFLIENGIGLGMRRLSVIDVDGGNQPIYNEDKSVAIIFNGEIYNFLALKKKLEEKGHKFLTKTDTEVLVHLYEEYDVKCLQLLDGMFSFAIWDRRKKRLFIARDKAGEKPLFYAEIGNTLVFSSELRSLLKNPIITKEIDKKALAEYFFYGFVPSPNSMIKNVKKLRASNYMLVDDSGISISNYWKPQYDKKIKINEKEAIRLTESYLNKAIDERLVSDVPLGIFLSGGIDSGLVAAMVSKKIKGKNVASFTLGFSNPNYDESKNAKIIASHLGIDTKVEYFESKEITKNVMNALLTIDEPMSDPSIIPTYVLSKFARKYVTVILSGDGGDELFGGYPKYSVIRIANILDKLPNIIKMSIVNSALFFIQLNNFGKKFDKERRFLIGMKFPMNLRTFIWVSVFFPKEVDNIILQPLENLNLFQEIEHHNRNFNGRDLIDKALYLDYKTFLADMYLVKVDRASMSCSLEVRCPFLDNDLTSFANKLNSNFKIRGFKTKYLLRKVAEKYLPKNIVNLKKKGFGIPLKTLINKNLKSIVFSHLEPGYIKSQGLLNVEYIQELVKDHFSGKTDNSGKIWRLIVFQEWYKRNIEIE